MSCEMTTNLGRRGVHGSVSGCVNNHQQALGLSRTTVTIAMVIIYSTSTTVFMHTQIPTCNGDCCPAQSQGLLMIVHTT